jgi:hypothetical protein
MSGNSMVVRQFCDVAFGWMPPHPPTQPWRVVRVELAQEGYCLGCAGVRRVDVLVGEARGLAVCQTCGSEMERSGDDVR